ncbi:HAMP domain-containing histidine kinase [Solirubrobacter phytolaccae]|uniref:histidine kinase n=1 Tax=Solirubrobacter phytolaccae TaxID=1404360 RepID=A0A9X3NBS6_9ACTN|nr:HAMP domain-containing sensor histidine kinase [Solirubrobacter phytolaccae]MDA0182010.1 HAMP domain-containing histidine kinase [Solirubrobacter phytolaccae]
MTIATWLLLAALTASLLRSHHRLVRVARASHELRGPISAVQLGLHGLSGEPARLAAIELELRRAGRALEDLVGARSRTGPERVDLAALVLEHEHAWATIARAHDARLHLAPPTVVLPFAIGGGDVRAPATVHADPLRIAQACANLVANAAEHGHGEVRVRVRASLDRVAIEVRDDGPGLPVPLAAMTAPARLRRGRRGHGLAIAASIASSHGGRLSADGPRMTLELPAASTRVPLTRRGRLKARLRRLARRPDDLFVALDPPGITAPHLDEDVDRSVVS